MSRPRGRRTHQVAVYLAEVELAAWDRLRSLEQGLAEYPPSRATWVMEQVLNQLHSLLERGTATEAATAQSILDTLAGEPIDWPYRSERSHGRLRQRRKPTPQP